MKFPYLLFLIHLIHGIPNNLITTIGKMLSINHYKHLAVLDHNNSTDIDINLWKNLMKRPYNLKLTTIFDNMEILDDQDFILILNFRNIDIDLWRKISNRPSKRTLILLKNSSLKNFTNNILEVNQYLGLYIVTYNNKNEVKFKEIISLKDQNRLIISEIEMNTIGMAKEISDLQGIHLNGITGEWRPYFIINNNNLYDGFLVEIFNEAAKVCFL